MKQNKSPLIRLAPWEHAPNAKPTEIEAHAQNTVPFNWSGETLQVAARFVELGDGNRYLCARFLGEEDDGNWVLGYSAFQNFPRFYSGGQRLRLTKQLKGLETRHFFPFGRLFHLGAEELGTPHPQMVFVAINGGGCWLKLAKEDASRSVLPLSLESDLPPYFHLPLEQGESLRSLSSSATLNRLRRELQNPTSDARFALDWQYKSIAEREDLVWDVVHSSFAHMRELMTNALRIEPVVQTKDGYWVWYAEGSYPYLAYIDSEGAYHMNELSYRLKVWNRLVHRYFAPTPNRQLSTCHSCVQRWLGSRFFNVMTQIPTQHERLEAALWLRGWARDKVAPRKLELLLSCV